MTLCRRPTRSRVGRARAPVSFLCARRKHGSLLSASPGYGLAVPLWGVDPDETLAHIRAMRALARARGAREAARGVRLGAGAV